MIDALLENFDRHNGNWGFLFDDRVNEAVIAEQFGGIYKKNGTEQESYDEIVNIVTLMGIRDEVNILHGAPNGLVDEKTPIDSEGARFIIEEAMKDDSRPLFVCNLDAITNLASAYLMEPRIAEKITVIWIGGGAYPEGGFEFNQNNDINAARIYYDNDFDNDCCKLRRSANRIGYFVYIR